MATVTLPYSSAGIAAFEQGDDYNSIELFAGDTPPAVTEDFPVASGVGIPAFSVVGLTGGNLVMAVSGTVVPIGITTAPVANTAVAKQVAVFRAGCFNPARLNWDASYSSDTLKAAAFRASPPPTNIVVRKTL